MKKSEITVSMPLTTFQELNAIKENYETLLQSLIKCFDLKGDPAEFNALGAFVLSKKLLPGRHQDRNFIIVEKK